MDEKHAPTITAEEASRGHLVAPSAQAEERQIKFSRECVADVWDEAQVLALAHQQEVGSLPDGVFAPDRARYFEMAGKGAVRLFTARDGGLLVGYAVLFVVNPLHYPATRWAMQDVLFVSPKYRGALSLMFLRWMDRELLREGVQYVYRHVTERNDYSRVLEYLEYQPLERTFLRRL